MKKTIKQQICDFIEAQPNKQARRTDILRFLFEKIYHQPYNATDCRGHYSDSFWKTGIYYTTYECNRTGNLLVPGRDGRYLAPVNGAKPGPWTVKHI